MSTDFEASLMREIAGLEERRGKVASELARIDGSLDGLRRAHAIYLGDAKPAVVHRNVARVPRQGKAPDPAKSKVWAYILGLLEDAPESGISVDELADRCAATGHHISRNTLRANLSNAFQDGAIDRIRVGYYRRQPESQAQGLEGDTPRQAHPDELVVTTSANTHTTARS